MTMMLAFFAVLLQPFCALSENEPVIEEAESGESGPDEPQSVEVNGDSVEFSIEDNKFYAKGNVVVVRGKMTLEADEVVYDQNSQVAVAEGNVILTMEQGTITGEKLTYNYATMEGDFMGARFYSHPYYGRGATLTKVDANKIVMENGYITTSDFDKPEWRLASKRIEIYPGEKAVARHMRMMAGEIPILYIPRFTQNLKEKEPMYEFTPGHSKDWGTFILTSWLYRINDNLKGKIHLDYRERRDFASGLDVDYRIPGYGDGVIRTYFMNERLVTKDSFFGERTKPTPERERFKAEWRHRWRVDKKTNAVLQYYKLSDSAFLKDFFEDEHDKDPNPETFFVLTRALKRGTLSFETNGRVNRFVDAVEKLPEVKYTLSSQEIGSTNFFLKNTTTYSNLTKKTASPSETRQKTMRVDVDNELSYPMKVGFIELKPFVGGNQTYYSKTKNEDEYNVIRGAYRTGADLSTKFYKVMDIQGKYFGMDINRLRHIITPSINYDYAHGPTIPSSDLDQFDTIDSKSRAHKLVFALENKLQTKRDESTVELLRFILDTDFLLKEDPGKAGFNTIGADIELRPTKNVRFYFDGDYDVKMERQRTANFDLYINGNDWYWNLGKRYHVDADDQITTELGWRINPKWKFVIYERFDLDTGTLKEQNYALVRDLHSWIMEVNLNSKKFEGEEITVVFTMKAFPDIGFDFGSSFGQNRGGSN